MANAGTLDFFVQPAALRFFVNQKRREWASPVRSEVPERNQRLNRPQQRTNGLGNMQLAAKNWIEVQRLSEYQDARLRRLRQMFPEQSVIVAAFVKNGRLQRLPFRISIASQDLGLMPIRNFHNHPAPPARHSEHL